MAIEIAYPVLYTVIEKLLSKDSPKAPDNTYRIDFYDAVQSVYDDAVEWPYWYTDDETGNNGDNKKPTTPVLLGAIDAMLQDQISPGDYLTYTEAIAQRILNWNSWYWATFEDD